MRKRLEPTLKVSTEYSYLRFIGPPQCNFSEVYLPDDSSYILDLDELRIFLRKCGVDDYEGLVDFIYNFGTVLWKRQDQLYYTVASKKLLPVEDLVTDVSEEISYVFN